MAIASLYVAQVTYRTTNTAQPGFFLQPHWMRATLAATVAIGFELTEPARHSDQDYVGMPATPEISFRRLGLSELPMLTRWLAEPHVRRFYQKSPVSLEDVRLEYGPAIRGEEPSSCHLAFCNGEPFAYLQCYRNGDYPDWARTIEVADGISIDLFVGNPVYLRRGLGRTALCAYLQDVAFPLYTSEHRAYIGHDLTNTAAVRCSQAAGFRPLRPFMEDGVEMLLLVINRADVPKFGRLL